MKRLINSNASNVSSLCCDQNLRNLSMSAPSRSRAPTTTIAKRIKFIPIASAKEKAIEPLSLVTKEVWLSLRPCLLTCAPPRVITRIQAQKRDRPQLSELFYSRTLMGIFDEGYQQSNRDTHDNWFDTPPVGFMEGAFSAD
jgi:hypothetical protein